MDAQSYWEEIGSKKEFEDLLYIDRLAAFVEPDSLIVEYGCGYGRMLQLLHDAGYRNLKGYDFSANMIQRGVVENPHLDLQLIDFEVPLEDGSVDALILSTILTSQVAFAEQRQLVDELLRVLKRGAVLYISDFLLCEKAKSKYEAGYKEFEDWGVYRTTEGLLVRHHTTDQVMRLLSGLDILWFEQFDFVTMNHNPARTFHTLCRKR